MYYLSLVFFLLYSFLKPTSEALLRLWLCTFVEDQWSQAMNNLNEMLRSKNYVLTLYAKWLQDPTNHIEVLCCWPWWFSRRTGSLLPTKPILNGFPLYSRHFLFVIVTITCQRNSLLSDSFMAFILFDIRVVPSPGARFALSKELLFRAFEASCLLSRTWKLMIKLLLVALTDAGVVLTTSLLHGLVNCSAVIYRKTLNKQNLANLNNGWIAMDPIWLHHHLLRLWGEMLKDRLS